MHVDRRIQSEVLYQRVMFTTDFSSKERTPRNSIKCNQISHHKISKRYAFETTKLFIELNSQRKHLTIEVFAYRS